MDRGPRWVSHIRTALAPSERRNLRPEFSLSSQSPLP